MQLRLRAKLKRGMRPKKNPENRIKSGPLDRLKEVVNGFLNFDAGGEGVDFFVLCIRVNAVAQEYVNEFFIRIGPCDGACKARVAET